MQKDGKLKIIIDSDPAKHAETSADSKSRDDLAEQVKNMKIKAENDKKESEAAAAAASS